MTARSVRHATILHSQGMMFDPERKVQRADGLENEGRPGRGLGDTVGRVDGTYRCGLL